MIRPGAKVSVSDVSQHYNDLDRIYRGVWGEHLHHGLWNHKKETQEEAVRNLVLKVREMAAIRPKAKVCDVGCGYGATARLLAREFQSQVLGLTVSDSQLKYALSVQDASMPGHAIRYQKRDWLRNGLRKNYFDHVIAIESSEHMSDLSRFFQEAYRVLKPGGSFVVCAWLTKEVPSNREIKYLLEPICSEGRLAGLGTPSEYLKMYRSAGFGRTIFEDLTKSVKRTWSLSIAGLLPYFIKNPRDLRLLSARVNPNINFLASLFRIRLAYELGSMRYGVFRGVKPKLRH